MRSRPVFSRVLSGGAAAAALALCLTLPTAAHSQDEPEVTAEAEVAAPTEGEQRLAKLLEGREAGEPLRCIRTMPSQRMETIPGTAYVYGTGSTIYIQRTRNPDDIRANDTLVSNRFNATQLCRFDVMTTVDRIVGFFTGAVFFEDFVPYTKVKGEG
jgi:hypothetical protein